jgi:iron(III) transport system permease protein
MGEGALSLSAYQTAFADPRIVPSLANTFILAVIRTSLSMGFAIFFAWVVTRTNVPMRGSIEFMLWMSFFLPSLPETLSWILLLDPKFGFINMYLRDSIGISPFNIYSYEGIIWAHLAGSTSIRFLLITPAFRTMDAALEEAARVSGCSNVKTLLRVTVPILAPALLVSASLGFIKALEAFETELVLGGRAGLEVFSTTVYFFISREPARYEPAMALSTVFLVTIFALIWLQRVVLGNRQYTTISGKGYSPRRANLGVWKWLIFGFCMLWLAILVILPQVVLVLGTFMRVFGFPDLPDPWTTAHWTTVLNDSIFLRSVRNTLILGLMSAILGALLFSVIAYLIVRERFIGRRILEWGTWLPWAVPGILLSFSLLLIFLGTGGIFLGLYGSIYLLIIAIVVQTSPVGTHIMRTGLLQVSKELEEVGVTSGASRFSVFRKVTFPLVWPSVVAVSLYIFLNAIKDIANIVFLASPQMRTLALLTLDYIETGHFEKAFVVGLMLTGIVIVVALLARVFGMRTGARE